MAGEITFTPTEQDYYDANRDWLLVVLRTRRALVRASAVVAFCAAAGGLAAYIDNDIDGIAETMAGFALLGLVLFVLINAVVYVTLRRRTRRLYRQQKTLHQSWTYRWEDSGLSVETANGRTHYPWSDFHRWLVGRRCVLLFFNDQVFFFLPRRVLGDGAAEALGRLAADAGVRRL